METTVFADVRDLFVTYFLQSGLSMYFTLLILIVCNGVAMLLGVMSAAFR